MIRMFIGFTSANSFSAQLLTSIPTPPKAAPFAVLYFTMDSNIQQKEDLMPGKWINRKLTESQIQAKMKAEIEKSRKHFREIQLKYIELIMKLVKFKNNDVQQFITKSKSKRSCVSYGKVYDNQKRKCDVCSSAVAVVKEVTENLSTPADWPLTKTVDIGQVPNINQKPMSVGELILLNPNSYESVESILDLYKKYHTIPENVFFFCLGYDKS